MFWLIAAVLSAGMFLVLRVSGGTYPKPLSSEREKELLGRVRNGDITARNELIEHNLRLVAHIIKKYYSSTDTDDLMSIGSIGLIKAIGSFDPQKNIRLATYASRCIENEILMYFRSQKHISTEISLSESIDTDRDGNSLELIDVLSADCDELDAIENEDVGRELRHLVKTKLDPREREIITLRFGLNGDPPMKQREVALKCGISRSYISRIEKRALETLKREFERS